jgi:hypothetical protein
MRYPQLYGIIFGVIQFYPCVIIDFRLARVKHDGEFTPFTDFESTFHNLQPHPALTSPETESDYLRLIADGCLAVLLPTEDLDSDCERTLIREILSSLILKKGLDLMSEPYMMYETISNVPSLIEYFDNRSFVFRSSVWRRRRLNQLVRH